MKCCANCFGDHGLRDEIAYRSAESGQCGYCGTGDEALVAPEVLADKFEMLMSIYEPDSNGSLLAHWLKEDWALFSHVRMDAANAQRLLGDVLNDGEIVRQPFVPSSKFDSGRFDQWEELKRELKHENRYFPEFKIDLSRLELLLGKLVMAPATVPTNWFRARIQMGDEPLGPADMNAPPPEIASHGRANPAGIPYLYLASDIVTAVSETRPHTGEISCVAEFITPGNLAIVDLRNPRTTISPFLLADEEEVGQMRFDLPFLERVGDELSRPIRPKFAAYDYTPSQYLCEFMKKCGFDGVAYRSSISDGLNLAIFNPRTAEIGAVQQYRVDRVVVDVSLGS